MLESFKHAASCFVTLTYSEETLPADGSVDPRTLQLFLKRLRRAIHPVQVRFFAVGEYGEITSRPHYHLALFGLPATLEVQELVSKAWGLGLVHVGEVNSASAQYLARYVVKKWTRVDAPGLGNRRPEFTRQSLRPGIGAHAMADVASALSDSHGQALTAVDVPTTLRVGRSPLVLGRYLRERLRVAMGRSADTPPLAKAKWLGELQDLLEAAGSYEAYRATVGSPNRCLSLETRAAIYAQKETL